MILQRTAHHPLVETVAKACGGDEGAQQVLVRMALYDALCDSVDELRPEIEEAVSKVVRREAARGLQVLAKRDITPESAAAAEHLWALTQVGKASDRPDTPFWDARDASGKFVSGSGRRGLGDGMKMLTRGRGEDSLEGRAAPVLESMVGPKATAYSRARVVGNGLTAIDAPETRALGTLARVVGEIGPEAQAALEPGIRRAAYRYRGTERRPDAATQRTAALIGRFAEEGAENLPESHQAALIRLQQELGASSRQETMSLAGQRGGGPREVLSPAAAALATAQAAAESGLSPDQVRMDAVGTYGVLKLRDQIPDTKVAELSLASGKMPPSLGLLMDADGRIVSEAMGFNGDHYLPFDLKNLKALKGGQYVRTRTSGGPTDEDIYTGLLTGARQIEVVSNSGVFKVEFDPDLRGGRRYSDKARQMVDRYARLVATIEQGDFEKTPLSREKLSELKQKALEDATGMDGRVNLDLADTNFKEAKAEAIRAERFNEVDEDALMDEARQIAAQEYRQGLRDSPNKPKVSNRTLLQTQRDVFNELKAKAYEGRHQRYKADGEGYKAALTALKQEFPYFIRRVEHTPLADYLIDRKQLSAREPLPGNRGSDQGYTPRGKLVPKGALGTADRMKTADELRGGPGRAAVPSTEAATTNAPVADGAAPKPLGTGARPATTSTETEQAPSFEQVASAPPQVAKNALARSLEPALTLANGLIGSGALEGPMDVSEPTIEAAFKAGTTGAIVGYLSNSTTEVGGPQKASNWLMTSATPEQIRMVKEKLVQVIGLAGDDGTGAGAKAVQEQLLTMLDQVAATKSGFTEAAGSVPELLDPMGLGDPKPVAFPEVVGQGASLKNLAAFAADPHNRQAAALADAYLGRDDMEIAQEIRDTLDEHDAARAPGAEKNPTLANLAGDLKNPASKPMQELRTKQLAFALKRANQVASLAAGKAPRPFSEGLAKRQRPPLRVLSPSDPVAKAYAQLRR